jgi:4-hydroxyphenylpyruvate dioxygenase
VSATSIGLQRIEALHYYVHDLDRTRRFFVDKLDFVEVETSGPELEREGRQRSAAFRAGDAMFVIHQPVGEGGRAWRYLRKHPEGVGTVVFDVEDIDRAFALLDERGGTFITDVQRFTDDEGTLAMFSITTPFGDTTFRFIERRGYRALYPGFVAAPAAGSGRESGNRFGFERIDHLTSNFQTMKPALLWMQHVLGLEQLWEIAFHTNDVAAAQQRQPFRPFFKESQINIFAEDNRGDGVQHSALAVTDIVEAVQGLRARSVEFMTTPGTYYDVLPERLDRIGVGPIPEDLDLLRDLQILVDGSARGAYLLQIFLKEAAGREHDREAGPFFFEIIQRKGDQGFGAGNFRALFEAIERDQQRTPSPVPSDAR